MAPRPLLPFVLAFVVFFAGCMSQAPPPGADDENGSGEEAQRGPFFGSVPGVEQIPLPAGVEGVIEGVVYDVTTGDAIAGATVTLTCIRQALPDLDGTAPVQTVQAKSDGTFVFPVSPAFADCVAIDQNIEAAGYEMAVPLELGPLTTTARTIVHAGMVPDP
jgi:hypothetical protein